MSNEKYCKCTWKHKDCFAYDTDNNGNCDALSDCDFPNRKDCPFYKHKSLVPDANLKLMKQNQ